MFELIQAHPVEAAGATMVIIAIVGLITVVSNKLSVSAERKAHNIACGRSADDNGA